MGTGSSIARKYSFLDDFNAGTAIDDRKVDEEFDQLITKINLKLETVDMSEIKPNTDDSNIENAFENFISGCWLYRSAGSTTEISVSPGSAMINNRLRRTTTVTTNTPTVPDAGDWVDVYLDASASATTWALEVQDSGTVPGGSTASSSDARLIGSIRYDSSSDLNQTINYRDGKVIGWTWQVGTNTIAHAIAVNFGVTFDTANDLYVQVTSLGARTTASGDPAGIGDFDADGNMAYECHVEDVTTTTFNITARAETGTTFVSSRNFGYIWCAYGRYT